MKYLVNRETKEHRIYEDAEGKKHYLPAEEKPNNDHWMFVEADAEGWIKWDCEADLDCPISDDQLYEARLRDGAIVEGVVRWDSYGNGGDVMAYRPILDKPEVEVRTFSVSDPLKIWNKLKPQADDIITRLKSAHEAAQSIPDLLAELREVLGSMGYDVVARDPFLDDEEDAFERGTITPVIEGAEQSPYNYSGLRVNYERNGNTVTIKQNKADPEPDMSDWRNWREGDLVEWQPGAVKYPWWTPGKLYEVTLRNSELVVIADDGDFYNISGRQLSNGARFRFYSRQKVKS